MKEMTEEEVTVTVISAFKGRFAIQARKSVNLSVLLHMGHLHLAF